MSEAAALSSNLAGRKIFFLYPTVSVQTQIISELAQHEYEVYSVKKHARLLQVLKNYPDAVVFINVDEGMSDKEWDDWIDNAVKSMPDIKIGIFSANTSEELHEKYIKNPHIECGFTFLKLDMSKAVGSIVEILNTVNAKGRRKYLRAATDRETVATMNMPYGGGFKNAAIRDISVVGISCVFEDDDPDLAKNTLCKDMQIRLQTMLLKVEGIMFGSRTEEEKKIYVFLFTQRIAPEVKTKIRKYIQQNLQHKMDLEIK